MESDITEISKILSRHPRHPSSLIMVLQDVQTTYNYLPETCIDNIATYLTIPRSHIYSVASFYQCFSFKPGGRHRVDVCMGTACHVRGAPQLVNLLTHEFDVKPGETTKDQELAINTVHCVGACAMGPVVVIDGEYHGEMAPHKVLNTIKKCCQQTESKTQISPSASLDRHSKSFPLTKISSPQEFEKRYKEIIQALPDHTPKILVCVGTGCLARGSLSVAEELKQELIKEKIPLGVELALKKTGCHGFCEQGPLVIFSPHGPYYTQVSPKDVKEIIEKTVLKNEVIPRLLYTDPNTEKKIADYQQIPFYALQQRQVLKRVGIVDPEDINDYIAHNGYRSLVTVLSSWKPEEVIDAVEYSGLRGKGGGGFSTGRKWRSCRKTPGNTRYVIGNGDEGDPGAFMDCSIMEGDPHAVIEGMLICAYAIGAQKGYLYVREEYPRAWQRLQTAIREAQELGLLGENIMGSGFSFDIQINRGAGAFICGESSALMQSIAGKLGEPRAKYVRSVEKGLFDQPTVLNNVETLATIPLIIEKGADWFAAIGTERSKGTKAFSIVGKVKNTGLVEVPMGTTLRTIIFDICGGILNQKTFKAVQTGGPSGGCLPESKLDLPVDFDTLTAEGSMMGSGGMIIMDENTCMIDVARYFTSFLAAESCGKCGACRMGLEHLKKILERICDGQSTPEDIPAMEKLFDLLKQGSLCGLGKSAANPVQSTLKHFREEYEAHIVSRKCPAGVCRNLINYAINSSCTGCQLCAQKCPQKAIEGTKKEIHIINNSKCDRCGLCLSVCNFNAISVA